MKRLGRILHRLLSGLSLLLLMATVGLWVRSYWVSESMYWFDGPENRSLFDEKGIWCSRGGIQFEACHNRAGDILPPDGLRFRHVKEPAKEYPVWDDVLNIFFSPSPRRYAAMGFQWIPLSTGKWNRPRKIDAALKSLTLPLYFPTLIFALLPAHYVLQIRRRRRIASRRARGCCVSCGYDLRASAERCPECGRDLAGRGT